MDAHQARSLDTGTTSRRTKLQSHSCRRACHGTKGLALKAGGLAALGWCSLSGTSIDRALDSSYSGP